MLVVDDELAMRTVLVEALQSESYRTVSAGDGLEALEKATEGEYDLVLLDVMMPGLDGFSVCSQMRKRGVRCPILMLTAKGMVDDRVRGLDSGADDYLVKPFSLKELLARVRALVRRSERREVEEPVQVGEVTIDLKARVCRGEGGGTELNEKEVGILRLLLECRGEVVSRERFLDEVWGYHASPTSRTVDNFISELRKKLGPEGYSLLKTVRGKGYQLRD